jgi:hypothetical protein
MAKRPSEPSRLLLAGAVAGGLVLVAGPAFAQFGQIFGAPPRPPANVPSRPPAAAPLGLPEQMPPEEMDDEPQPPPARTTPPAGAARPQQPGVAVAPPGSALPGAVRSQPLAPPPGASVAPPGAVPPGQAAVPPPGQRLQVPRGQQPANATPQDEIVTEMPSQKIVNPTAVFAGLDKITGRIIAFEVGLNEKVQFGALQVTPRVCYTRPPTETANTDSFVEVDEVTLQGEVKRLFSGWMFAASPGINAVEHPIYDVWLTDCKGGATVVSDAQPAAPAAPAQRLPQPRTGTAAASGAGTSPAGAPARPPAPRPPAQQVQPQQQDVPPVPPPFRR